MRANHRLLAPRADAVCPTPFAHLSTFFESFLPRANTNCCICKSLFYLRGL